MNSQMIKLARATGEWASGSSRLLVIGVDSKDMGERLVSQISINYAKREEAEAEARRVLERAAGGLFQRFLADSLQCSIVAESLGYPGPADCPEPYDDSPKAGVSDILSLMSLVPLGESAA